MGSSQLNLEVWASDVLNGLKNQVGPLGLQVLEKRCLVKNDRHRIIETPDRLFRRVARAVAYADLSYNRKADVELVESEFYRVMTSLEFLPNSPTLMSAGTQNGQLSACFVLPIEDSIKSIFSTLGKAARIHKSGGGTGFSFSNIRPMGDIIRSTKGSSSGPLSFIRIFDQATEVIKMGGLERGANMAVLRVDHPDIMQFVQAKSTEGMYSNFNFSVAVTDSFMKAAKKRECFYLRNPRSKTIVKEVKASKLLNEISKQAWQTGEPGILMIDEIERGNPTPNLGALEATNTCGEMPLLPYESCVLGSINLSKIVSGHQISWKKLEHLIRVGVHFLDNVIDVTKHLFPQSKRITLANRKIGLGVMGFADMLLKLAIPYNSNLAVKTAESIMKFVSETARNESMQLAIARGSFKHFNESIWHRRYKAMRNATTTTIAPTGTISIIAGCSQSIEPLFSLAPCRQVMGNLKDLGINSLLIEEMKRRDIYSETLIREIMNTGSIQGILCIPDDLKRVFVTAQEIEPEWHVRVQAAFQKYTDNGVAKTVNMPFDSTIEDVRSIFVLSHELHCKGITVYRDGSRSRQVIYRNGAVSKQCQCS